jgi:hypothetical protein
MKTIEAIYNAGRWMVYCPIHGNQGAVLALDYHVIDPTQSRFWTAGGLYICPVCYPKVTAQMQIVRNGRIETVPDISARKTARLLAQAKDEIYQVMFPKNREKIEQVLSERLRLMQNWDGAHETLKFLQEENKFIKAVIRGL